MKNVELSQEEISLIIELVTDKITDRISGFPSILSYLIHCKSSSKDKILFDLNAKLLDKLNKKNEKDNFKN